MLKRFVLFAAFVFAASDAFAQSPQDRFVTVNGLRLHYLDWGGDGKQPLILLHGIGRVAHTFDHIAPHFSPNYHVLAVDMRGHGDSGWDSNAAYLVEDYPSEENAKDYLMIVDKFLSPIRR